MKQLFFSLLILTVFAFKPPHPHHITIMQIDHKAEVKALQVTLKGFVNDLELGLKDMHQKPVYLERVTPESENADLVSAFVQKNVRFNVNGQLNEYAVLGWEIEKDEAFFYLEIKGIKKIESLIVRNEMLMKQFEDQTNIVHLAANGKNKSLYLNTNEREKAFEF
jgi:hypothetical protein